MIAQQELVAALRARHVSEPIIERILRLNPKGVKEGEIVRGWHRKQTGQNPWWDAIGVKRFIAIYGREALYALPREAFTRNGKRRYVSTLKCMQILPLLRRNVESRLHQPQER